MAPHAAIDSKSAKATATSYNQDGGSSDAEVNAASEIIDRRDISSLQSSLGAGEKKQNSNTNGEEATLDTKTMTTYEAGCLTQSGSQSARKETNIHYSGGANLFQLTASQSVDLIKPSEQMRDTTSDSKAYSTKSYTALSGAKPTGGSGKKGAKETSSNQRRKKSNSKSSAAQRADYEDLARKTTLVKEFIE